MTRSEARRNAFLYVFQLYANDELVMEDSIELEDGLVLEADEFTHALVSLTVEHREQIDEIISSNLKGWTLKRLPKVSLAILRISVAQLLYMQDVPSGAVINEAVDLAKQFGNTDDYQFINGALGNIEKSLNK